ISQALVDDLGEGAELRLNSPRGVEQAKYLRRLYGHWQSSDRVGAPRRPVIKAGRFGRVARLSGHAVRCSRSPTRQQWAGADDTAGAVCVTPIVSAAFLLFGHPDPSEGV